MVQRVFQAVVLLLLAIDRHLVRLGMTVKQPGEVQAPGLPMFDGFPPVEHVHSTDHFVDRAETHLGHDLPHLFGDEREVVDQVFRPSGKHLAEFGVLGRDAHRTGTQVALAQHDAAVDHQSAGSVTELLRSQKSRYGGVTPCLELAVGLQCDPAAQVVGHQHLLGLGNSQFPWKPCVLDRRLR